MNKRQSGVLLNVSSMPCDFGIGGFSSDIENFLNFIREMGFTLWQTLPISPIGVGNSPYSGTASFAINYLYVDPISLKNDCLISDDDVNSVRYNGSQYVVDYDFVKVTKKHILEIAYINGYARFSNEIKEYYKKQSYWLEAYAIFMTLKEKYNGEPWWNWDNEYKFYKKLNKDSFKKENLTRFNYYVFEQYILERQWAVVRNIANLRGIAIMGDLPIYVMLDSVDVWANPENYQLDKELKPTKVAGVPPDYFSKDGQLWGNPLYNYDYMRKTNYSWWLKRFERTFELYDGVRVDHFRGFSAYWVVDAKETTAKNGKWEKGPGMDLFSLVKQRFQDNFIIAEDLGKIDEDTVKLLQETGFPGMRVMQFAFADEESTHLPHNYPINCVAYTATHDNDTTLGWLYSQQENVRDYALTYCGFTGFSWGAGGQDCTSNKAFIKTLIASSAKIAIIPMQDLCGYGSDARMNIPGKAEGNWIYRTTYTAFSQVDRQFMLANNNIYGRNNSYVK